MDHTVFILHPLIPLSLWAPLWVGSLLTEAGDSFCHILSPVLHPSLSWFVSLFWRKTFQKHLSNLWVWLWPAPSSWFPIIPLPSTPEPSLPPTLPAPQTVMRDHVSESDRPGWKYPRSVPHHVGTQIPPLTPRQKLLVMNKTNIIPAFITSESWSQN